MIRIWLIHGFFAVFGPTVMFSKLIHKRVVFRPKVGTRVPRRCQSSAANSNPCWSETKAPVGLKSS